MSSLLEQAIIDATQLKEAALKNAESMIIEKYSVEIKEAVDSLLEQPEDEEDLLDFDMGDDAAGDEDAQPDELADGLPTAALDGEKACACPEEDEEIEIDFDELSKKMDSEEEELEDLTLPPSSPDELSEQPESLEEPTEELVKIPSHLGPELHFYHSSMSDPIYKVGSLAYANRPVPKNLMVDAINNLEELKTSVEDVDELQRLIDELNELLPNSEEESSVTSDMEELEELDLSNDILSDMISQLEEELKVDMDNVANSWAFGATESTKDEGAQVALAREQDDDVKEETKAFNKAAKKLEENKLNQKVELLQKQINSLTSLNGELKSVAKNASNILEKVNLENAKLLYENRILRSDSLNERQKKVVVDALSKAGSIEEAKVVFETANEALTTSRSSVPRTLNEHLNKGNSITLKMETKQKRASVSNFDKETLQRLAGIKK